MMMVAANWISARELWLLPPIVVALLFPGPWTPPALGVVLLLWLARWLVRGRPSVTTPAEMPMAIVLIMSCAGWLVSADRSASTTAWWRILLGMVTYYALVNGLRGRRPRWLPTALCVACLALAALALLGTEWGSVRLLNLPQIYNRLPHWMLDIQDQQAFNPRVMGMALATLLPTALAVMVFSRDHRLQVLGLVSSVAGVLTVLLTQSVQAAFGLAWAVLFLGVLWKRWFILILPLSLAGALLGLFAYGWERAALAAISPQAPFGIAASLRLDMWSRAVAMIRDMPYTGIGLDSFPLVQSNFYPGVMLGPEPHAHNLLLQVALDLGIPGLIAFLCLVGNLVRHALRAQKAIRDTQERALLLGATGGVVAYVTCGLLDTIWTAKPSVLVWVNLGLMAALSSAQGHLDHQRPAHSARSRLGRLAPAVLALVIVALVAVAHPGSLDLNLAIAQSRRLVLSAQAGQMPHPAMLQQAAGELQAALAMEHGRPEAHVLLARTLAWSGEEAAALVTLQGVVEMDGRNAVAHYAPFENLRRRLAPQERHDPWADMLWPYQNWISRYPARAENYVLAALVQRYPLANPAAARETLQAGIRAGAVPDKLFTYAMDALAGMP